MTASFDGTVSDARKFRASLFRMERYRIGGREYPAYFGWTPNYPAAIHGSFAGLSDEALFRSNYEMTLESSADAGLSDVIRPGSDDTFEIVAGPGAGDALRLAYALECECADYPVLDEMHHSEIEIEMIAAGIEDYFASDAIRAMREDGHYGFLFKDDSDGLEDDVKETVNREIHEMACQIVAYSGELYVHEMADLTRAFDFRTTPEEYAANLKTIIADVHRVEFEKTQPPMFTL